MKRQDERSGIPPVISYRFRVPAVIPGRPSSAHSTCAGKSSATLIPSTRAKTTASKSPNRNGVEGHGIDSVREAS